jgi:small-conductance mechanosensitive channel
MSGVARGQSTTEAPPAPAEDVAAPAIPLADVITEAESVSTRYRDIRADLAADRSTEAAAQRLPGITREIDGRLRESRRIVAQSPSIEILRGMEREWSRVRRELSALNKDLTGRVHELQRHVAQLDEFAKKWHQTFAAARDANVPPEVLRGIENVVNEIQQARDAVEKQRARTLTIQSRVGVQDSRVDDALSAIDQALEKALDRLFLSDSPPIWRLAAPAAPARDLGHEISSSFLRQSEALSTYIKRQAMRLMFGGSVFIALAGALLWISRRAHLMTRASGTPCAARVLELPLASALLLSAIGSRWIFPEAPRLMWSILGALALIPSALIARRTLRSDLHPVLYALIAFFFLDQLRVLAAAVQVVPRLLFVGEMLGVAIFSAWLVGAVGRQLAASVDAASSRKLIRSAAYVALVLSSTALVANMFGYATFATLLGNTLLQSCYLALILYAVVEIVDGLAAFALSLRPFAALGTISRYRSLVQCRLRRGLQTIAVVFWFAAVLQRLLLRDRLFAAVHELLSGEISFGSIKISPGDILAFIITVWAAFLVSRFVRFLLDEDVYPRVRLKRGLSYAISNTLHYLILVGGFFLAVAALGFDMTQVTILAGAFSVGVGFGLQNVFNNFISGLILLFERPINIGDVVQIDDASGVVERIGVRASIIRTTNGSEIIMPNGKLISERLVNWTLSSRQHGIELPIAVAQGNDPGKVISLLEQTAARHPLITGDPPPQALVVKLGADSLGLELRAWTDHSEQWMRIRSELAIAISSVLAAEKIAIR